MNKTLTLVGAFAALCLVTLDASATLVVKCETRTDRSRASVDGSNLVPGMYSARLSSGANTAQSPLAQTVGDEVAFDFDSNKRDIKKGATPIAKNFIVGGQATGTLLDANGAVVKSKTVNCRAR
ncbi:hypothetical protein [Ideonella sp.]|uniref:hypothetical protein n=1 Tax=Ideonella sp. TaxID=1929293 RepID=UPI002B492498|nr:hypothetical protein [Ideonella sp.]HJV69265.1 hypothetical protein [Ideonella sp.]